MTDSAQPHQRKTMKHLYVSVDTCAELGGSPYKVLEALHDVYDITKRRELKVIDTAQGFLEKTDFISPHMMETLKVFNKKFTEFAHNNKEWVEIVETDTCRMFQDKLKESIFPDMVDPMTRTIEKAQEGIKQQTFTLMQERGMTELHGIAVRCAEDVPMTIQFVMPNPQKTPRTFKEQSSFNGHYVFTPKIVSEAADSVLPSWREDLAHDKSLLKKAKIHQKGELAMMVKTLQESKAIAHTLLLEHNPEIAALMGETPPAMQEYASQEQVSLDVLRQHSHLYADMTFPDEKSLGTMKETIQAVRLTSLWPWARKGMLTDESKATLKESHKNTADKSYLDMFVSVLPEMSLPEESLYILLTHDMPLRRQFLEVTTGVCSKSKTTHGHGKKSVKDYYQESHIHDTLSLQKRPIEAYCHEAIWVGSEFVEFAYKEVVAALSPYIDKVERKQLLDIIKSNHPDNKVKVDVADALINAIDGARDIEDGLQTALRHLTECVVGMEGCVKRDIQSHGAVKKHGHYDAQKAANLEMRSAMLGR